MRFHLQRPRVLSTLAALALAASAAPAAAEVRLPAILSDHMVLQRGAQVPVWGWADPGEKVTVRLGARSRSARAGADGRWRVTFDLRGKPETPAAGKSANEAENRAGNQGAGTPTTLLVSGEANAIAIKDVLLGEVWLASGQSNMEKPVGEKQGQQPTFNAEQEIAAANYPDIRFFKVERSKARQPQDDVAGEWVRCSPESLAGLPFSAAAYFFGRRLHTELAAPVGLIASTWGGTRIELWTAGAQPTGLDPDAATLYNGMVAGLAPFALKGAIWYQGESNIIDGGELSRYAASMATLVAGWRRRWGADFAFYYAQVAPHLYHVVRHAKVIDPQAAALMREAQADALRIPGTGMIVTTDLVDDLRDIHPRDKKTVGLRLANLALAQSYGRGDIAAYGPSYRAMTVENGKAVVSFDHAEGLAARDGKALSWFDIAGADGRWHPGAATIVGGKVVVASPDVPQPAKVRFAWDEAAQPNLVNGAGLPAVPFRSRRD